MTGLERPCRFCGEHPERELELGAGGIPVYVCDRVTTPTILTEPIPPRSYVQELERGPVTVTGEIPAQPVPAEDVEDLHRWMTDHPPAA